ncbi:hypothetical protein ACN6LL_002033, partial [Streptomyces violaceoruber]
FFDRTGGVVGLLERLIEDGCQEAIDSGAECLTEPLLDGIAITLDRADGRDLGAGEIPDIPEPKEPKKSSNRARPRNTVLDDQGPAAGGPRAEDASPASKP